MKAPSMLILSALLALLLVLPACTPVEKKDAAAGNPSCNWPPDTLKITLQGSGRIAVNFLWKDAAKRAIACQTGTFTLATGPEPEAHQILLRESHTPQDTTPAARISAILGAPASSTDGTDLLFVKWPPDTTTGGSK